MFIWKVWAVPETQKQMEMILLFFVNQEKKKWRNEDLQVWYILDTLVLLGELQ